MKTSGKMIGFTNSEIAAELKAALLYREYDNPVQKVADMLGLKARTVYDYFDGHIKISLPFLHACLIVTGGDRDVKKFLCPEGWDILPMTVHSTRTEDIETEFGDVHIAFGDLQKAIRAAKADSNTSPSKMAEIEKLLDSVRVELNDIQSCLNAEKLKQDNVREIKIAV
ncbi:hypothetical protein [Desulforegula conservatrix]|uniref:hypothetical protein n=1 Tax=Desulforegula conservatrix TaxID=153026 RepID=UPI0003F639D9|nr:hypothetical protein [Desulforegula conservatrix]